MDIRRDTVCYFKKHRVNGIYEKYGEVFDVMSQLQISSGFTLGKRRMCNALRPFNINICERTAAKLMKIFDLRPERKIKSHYRSYDKDAVGEFIMDSVQRKFDAPEPSLVFVTDITQFNVRDGLLYLSCFVDLYNNEIISFSIGRSANMDLCLTSLRRAIPFRHPTAEKVIHHSDNGKQYYSQTYQALLKEARITQSMSTKGDCYDNGAMESVFGRIKSEMFDTCYYQSYDELAVNIKEYIKLYNCSRPQTELGGLSPVGYRFKYYKRA